jgi:hypothetical protein
LQGYYSQVNFKNNEWDIFNISGKKKVNRIKDSGISWNVIYYTFEVRRHAGLYVATVVAPTFSELCFFYVVNNIEITFIILSFCLL